jgi:hypothetical protein
LVAQHLVNHLDQGPPRGPSRTPQPLKGGRVVDPLPHHQHPLGPLDPGPVLKRHLQLLGQPPLDLGTDRLGIKDDLVNAGATWVDEPAFRDGNLVWGRARRP